LRTRAESYASLARSGVSMTNDKTTAAMLRQAAADAHAREVLDRLRAWHRTIGQAAAECAQAGGPKAHIAGAEAEWHERALRKLDDLEGR
jgi:hypothetical protein